MAVRLQLKLGAVTDQDRLADSPDTVVVVEPSVGSVARTKGNLYLLVTSRVPGAKAREATRLVAETIRDEYYYDESAGIRQCLVKVLGSANKKLAHQRDRLNLSGADVNGPIGVAVAVVRGREMYVATVGPAEAYLIRQARLSTLQDPNEERGLPAGELVPEVWRGELTVGDALCLISANLMARVGTDTLKDALVTLHPQSAIEHVHARFVSADGRGSDGAIAFEATEVGATFKQKTLVPVRPAEPLAGIPDKGPIPLADSMAAGAAAVGDGAARAKNAAGNGFQRLVWRVQDLLPKRGPANRKVSTTSSRLQTQQRAAVAFIAIVAVAALLGGTIWMMGGNKSKPGQVIASATVAQQAFDKAKQDLDKINGSGQDLIKNDPNQALQLLQDANTNLTTAEQAGSIPVALTQPLRTQINAGLDQLYGVVHVASTAAFTFPASAGAVQLRSVVRGSDGAPYVLDTGTHTVWRIDLAKKTASPVYKSGQSTPTGKPADPKFMTLGGPDILILDVKNVLWRWRPIGIAGRGTLAKVNVSGSTTWGNDVKVVGTFVTNWSAAFYLLYVVQPSQQNIMKLAPNNDGSGYTTTAVPRLPASRDVTGITSLLIDGDIYATENGTLERLIPTSGWKPANLPDTDIRPTSTYSVVVSPNNADGSYSKGTGTLYAWDTTNHRVVAFAKNGGKYIAQYVPVAGGVTWSDLQDIEVLPSPGTDVPTTMWWVSSTGFYTSLLTDVQPSPTASPSASPTPSITPKPGKTPKPSGKPKATPKPAASPSPKPS